MGGNVSHDVDIEHMGLEQKACLEEEEQSLTNLEALAKQGADGLQ
jgi:hypothetical protein